MGTEKTDEMRPETGVMGMIKRSMGIHSMEKVPKKDTPPPKEPPKENVLQTRQKALDDAMK